MYQQFISDICMSIVFQNAGILNVEFNFYANKVCCFFQCITIELFKLIEVTDRESFSQTEKAVAEFELHSENIGIYVLGSYT